MVDTQDLKSCDRRGRTGSSPVPGTIESGSTMNRFFIVPSNRKSMRSLCILLLAACNFPLRAQFDDLLRHPDISWISTFTADYELNPVYNDNPDAEYNLLEIIRLENRDQANGLYRDAEPARYLSREILDGLQAGSFPCFADELLTQPLTRTQVRERLERPERIPGLGAQTNRDAVQPADIDLFRVRQLLYFNARKQVFETRLLAVAPLLNLPDAEGNVAAREPVLWIKISAATRKQIKNARNNAAYTWQTRQKDNIPVWVDLSVQKGKMDLQAWASAEAAQPSHPVLRADNYAKIGSAPLQALIFTTDTLNTFNDDGQSVIDRIVQKNAIDQVEKLRLVQHWYFDKQRKILGCRLVAVAPVAAIRDEEGELRYEKPLFYIRY